MKTEATHTTTILY